MAEVVEGYDCVVEMGWHWFDAVFDPASALASTPVGEGCQCYTVTLRVSPALC
jgi:hypothetical protein